MFTMDTLRVPDTGTLTDHRAIHNLATDHFRDWYHRPTSSTVDWSSLLAHRPSFLAHTNSKGIPPHLRETLWSAITEVPKAPDVHAELATALAQPPSLDEFTAAIQAHRVSTSPGATGLTYTMVRGWPPDIIQYAHQCLSMLWHADHTPEWMQWGWLCPKPKDPEADVTLEGLRPLILLEVLRKIWVGITIDKITSAWDRHGILSDSQHGFRHGRGTDTALLQFINAKEHAKETGTPLYTSSWDIRRAFDSVPREAMELSWTRLGVPARTAKWLAYMDVNGPTAIRSPWALHAWQRHGHAGFSTTTTDTQPATFDRGMGTPQGDVSSPHNWTAFWDMALAALALMAAQHPDCNFLVQGPQGTYYSAGDLGYADDLQSLARTLAGLQHKADIISAFCICFDLTLSVTKLRAAVFNLPPPH